jgi:LPXTG-site transpeptidase (sortase) family protein
MPRKRTKITKNNSKALDQAKRRGLGFVVVGCSLMFIVVVYRFQQLRRLSFDAGNQLVQSTGTLSPAKTIRLSRYRVTLDVTEAGISDGVWQISENTANHLNQSANPGEGGNVVIYGHNSSEVFGPLRWMSKGEEIEVTNNEGKVTIYVIDQIIETNPEDIQWILPKDKETLTVYTCSGFLNSKRHVVVAYPKK